MEPEIAVVFFDAAPNKGLKCSSYTGDENATQKAISNIALTTRL